MEDYQRYRYRQTVRNPGADPLKRLNAYRELHQDLEELLEPLVVNAKRCGCTWEEIGDALGVTRPAVFQRFKHLTG